MCVEATRRIGLIETHPVLGGGMTPRQLGVIWSSEEAHMVDALAVGGDEGRGSLRKAWRSWQRALIPRCPNGETHPARGIPH